MDIPTTPRDPSSKAKPKALNENKEKLRTNVDYNALFDVQDGQKNAVMSAYDLAWIEKRSKVMKPVRTFVNLNE